MCAVRRWQIRLSLAVLCVAMIDAASAVTLEVHATPPVIVPQVIYNGPRDEKRIAITFDACSSIHMSQVDKKLVQILVDNHIPATLFLGGKWVLDQPKEARYLASIPYFEIANHSFHHPHLTRMSAADIRHELAEAQAAIERVTGVTPRYFRAPYGEYNATLVDVAASLGLTTVQFDLASGDPDKSFTAERLSKWVIHKARSGSIVVMHINTHGWHTAEALPEIITALRAKGYQFVTVSELLNEPFPAPPGMALARNEHHLQIPVLHLTPHSHLH